MVTFTLMGYAQGSGHCRKESQHRTPVEETGIFQGFLVTTTDQIGKECIEIKILNE